MEPDDSPAGRSWPRWIAKFVFFTIVIYIALTFACDPLS